MITLIKGEYDTNKVNKEKILFQDSDIIQAGFVKKLSPKHKTFYRYSGDSSDKIPDTCKFSEKNDKIYEDIVEILDLKKNKVPNYF